MVIVGFLSSKPTDTSPHLPAVNGDCPLTTNIDGHFYASGHRTDVAGGIMFSGCPSACACVRRPVWRTSAFPIGLPSTSSLTPGKHRFAFICTNACNAVYATPLVGAQSASPSVLTDALGGVYDWAEIWRQPRALATGAGWS